MSAPPSDALVFFGASGDLVYKKIFPALQALVQRHDFHSPIIGVARSPWTLERFRARARESLERAHIFDPDAFAKLSSLLHYISGEYQAHSTYTELCAQLGNARRPLYYLAIPPSLFEPVVSGLAESDCARDARVVVEKPFGRDLTSARALNRTLLAHFPEHAIFRIDHYLGKEPVQNLIYFRFANELVAAGWNRRHVDSVQVTMAERFGVEGRGKFYEESGAIRDVVQNHMLQVIACLGMECPTSCEGEALRDEIARLLESVQTLESADVGRGQYRGYRQEVGVAPDSQTETFATLRLQIHNERWFDVPFYVRVGKCLPCTATEVLVRFRTARYPLLGDVSDVLPDYLRFRLSPDVVLALGTKVKKVGGGMRGEPIELIAQHNPPDEMEPYERLLSDAIRGDQTLFARQDAVEASWRIVDPILADPSRLYFYEPGTWGPVKITEKIHPKYGWLDDGGTT